MRVKPGLLEKQQRRQQQSHVNTSEDKVQLQKRRENLDYDSWMTDVQKTFLRDSHLQVCPIRHHDGRHSEEARATNWDVKLPVLRAGECTKSKNNWKENSRVRIGRLAFTAEDSNL